MVRLARIIGRGFRAVWSALMAVCLRLRGVSVGSGCSFYGYPRITRARGAAISIGDRCVIRSGSRSNPFSQGLPVILSAVTPAASLVLANDVRVSDCVIVASQSVTVGAGTYVGIGVLITDTDAHPPCPTCREQRSPAPRSPVSIGSACFIGARSTVLKGVTLPDQTCVGAGSVVTVSPDAPGTLVAGNPARVLSPSVRCSMHQEAGAHSRSAS